MVSAIEAGTFPRGKNGPSISGFVSEARQLGVKAVQDGHFAYYADGHYEQIVGTPTQEFFKSIKTLTPEGRNLSLSLQKNQTLIHPPELQTGITPQQTVILNSRQVEPFQALPPGDVQKSVNTGTALLLALLALGVITLW